MAKLGSFIYPVLVSPDFFRFEWEFSLSNRESVGRLVICHCQFADKAEVSPANKIITHFSTWFFNRTSEVERKKSLVLNCVFMLYMYQNVFIGNKVSALFFVINREMYIQGPQFSSAVLNHYAHCL